MKCHIIKTMGSTLLVMLTFALQGTFAASFDPAGAINSHDIEMIKQQQRFQQEKRDFQQYEERKDKTPKQLEDENVDVNTKPKPPQIKAKVSEYKTKGVYIEKIEFSKSEIFSQTELDKFAQRLEGQNIFIEDAQELINEINFQYAEKGYVTARAFLIPQTMENNVLKIQLVEGKVGDIDIFNNRWTRSSYIQKRIKAEEGKLFDIVSLEQDLMKFNRYNDGIKLKASLYPGKENETTDIEIKAEEEFPFHITGLFDNAGRETIGKLRGGGMIQADSLFGYRDKLLVGAYASRSSVTPFADYNIPVNKYDGRVGFTYSTSHSSITSGPFEMFNIKSRSHTYSLYYSHPLIRKPNFELTGMVMGNYKRATTSFDGYDLDTTSVTSAEAGLYAKYDSKRGIWYASQGVYQAFPMFDEESKYFKYTGSLTRLHDFGHGIVGQFRTNYQVVPQDQQIPYVDQFQSGGLATVRGYSEGLLIGKSGYFMSAEIIFPILPSKIRYTEKSTQQKKEIPFLGKWVKAAYFIDHAGVFPYKGSGPGVEGYNANDTMLGTGLGLRIALPGDVSARLYWGFPLIRNSHETEFPAGRFHFELAVTPDFYSLIQLKHKIDAKKLEQKVEKELPEKVIKQAL